LHHYLHYSIQTGPENAQKTTHVELQLKRKHFSLFKKVAGGSTKVVLATYEAQLNFFYSLKAPIFNRHFHLSFKLPE